MKKTIATRLERFRNILSRNTIDTFMVLIEENRRYLSGFTGEDTQFDESAGALFITATDLMLATDSRFDVQAGSEAPGYEIVCHKQGLVKALPHILDALKTKRLGFESVRLSCLQYEKITGEINARDLDVELVPCNEIIENLRIVKEPPETAAIRKALAIAESVFEKLVPTLKPGMTESSVAWEMEKAMREAGAEALSFPSIIASGPNSALPHAIPGPRKLMAGEPLLFDWGVKRGGYCSDISRTVILGRADETFTKVYRTVLEAQALAIDAIKPGVSTKAVDDIARNHINRMGFEGRFGHGLGHGVGLAVHEPPRLSPLSETVLEPGMVVTVEPGIYLPEWGGVRLENLVAVTENGAEVLNGHDLAGFDPCI